MNIKPLFGYVLVKPVETEEKTSFGIIIPDNAKEKPEIGEVKEVGVDSKVVKVGQKILYKKWGGNEVTVDNEDWLLIEEADIMAIVK